jgi:hypothetical protein
VSRKISSSDCHQSHAAVAATHILQFAAAQHAAEAFLLLPAKESAVDVRMPLRISPPEQFFI